MPARAHVEPVGQRALVVVAHETGESPAPGKTTMPSCHSGPAAVNGFRAPPSR
ncbi:MAG: hypothetical protein ABR613_12090 [Actinomycetota bacterium]